MGIISAALEDRDAAIAEFGITGRHTDWLPSMERLKADLRPTWDEVTRLQLRGFASIDPPSEEGRRHRKTQQRQQQRRAKGVQPQASRNLMEQRRRIAECFGVTVRQVQRWELKGVVPPERVQTLSPPCRDLVRGDTNWTSLVPANDDAEPEMLPLTETGYRGRNMSMKAWEVQAVVDRHPALAEDLEQHLDAIDAIMVKTPPENHGRVRKHLLQDRNRLALRKMRIEAAAVAPEPQDAFVGQNVTLTSDEVTGLAKRFPTLAADIHRHLSELEGPLKRVPDENRVGAMRRLVGRRSQLVLSRQRSIRTAA